MVADDGGQEGEQLGHLVCMGTALLRILALVTLTVLLVTSGSGSGSIVVIML